MVVAGLAAYTDINRAHEVANEVRRVAKQLKECQGLAQVYNNRERLFGVPITNVRYHRYTERPHEISIVHCRNTFLTS